MQPAPQTILPEKRPDHWVTAGWLALVLLTSAVLRLILFNGLNSHDDWVYLFYVRSHLNNQNTELLNSLWGLRWGIWYPVALLFKLFGANYWLTFTPGFILGLAAIPLAYFATLRMSGRSGAARWASVAMIINPIDWFVSTTLRGDIEMSFYAGLMMLGVAHIETQKNTRSAIPVALLVGFAWGMAALTKEWAFIFGWGFLAITGYRTLREKRIPWAYAGVLIGFLIVMIADAIFLYQLTGNPIQRITQSINWFENTRREGGYLKDLSITYAYLPSILLNISNNLTQSRRFLTGYPIYGCYFYLFFATYIGNSISALRRSKPVATLLCWLAGILLWIEFGSMSLSHYIPYHKEPRYFTILTVPIACCIGVAVDHWWARCQLRGRLCLLLGTILLFTNIFHVLFKENHEYTANRKTLNPKLFAWLELNPTARLWIDPSLQQDMDLRFGYRFHDPIHGHLGKPGYGAIMDISFVGQAQQGDYILINPREAEALINEHYEPAHLANTQAIIGEENVLCRLMKPLIPKTPPSN